MSLTQRREWQHTSLHPTFSLKSISQNVTFLTFCTISHTSVQTYIHLLKKYIFKIAVDETIYSCQITKLD